MKKGWKIFWIVAGAMAGVGIIICCIALAMGLSFNEFREKYPDGLVLFGRNRTIITENGEYRDTDHRSTDHSDGDYSHSYHGINSLKLELTGCDVYIVDSDEDEVHVDTDMLDFGSNGVELNVEEENGKLTLQTIKDGKLWTKLTGNKYFGTLYIYLPRSLQLDSAELTLGGSQTYIDRIHAKELTMNVGAGDYDVYNFYADTAVINIGAGEIEMTGDFGKSFNMKCGAGSAEIDLSGEKYDYNYSLKCGIGEIEIGDAEYEGLANARTVDNGAGKDLDIIVGAGSATVSFDH